MIALKNLNLGNIGVYNLNGSSDNFKFFTAFTKHLNNGEKSTDTYFFYQLSISSTDRYIDSKTNSKLGYYIKFHVKLEAENLLALSKYIFYNLTLNSKMSVIIALKRLNQNLGLVISKNMEIKEKIINRFELKCSSNISKSLIFAYNNERKIVNNSPNFPYFKVTRIISESAQSSVYEAYINIFENSHRIVLKLIHPKFIFDKKKIENNIPIESFPEIKFYQFYMNDLFACEFIKKPFKIETNPLVIFMKSSKYEIDLFEFIDNNDLLSNERIYKIFIQIAKGIDYLHTNGIAHWDIKDENIIINTINENIKLIDFGSSVFLKDFKANGQSVYNVGTYLYTPVEILKGKLYSGPEQDIWCLGIVFYILCFKEFPFHSQKEILQGILRLPVVRPNNFIHLIRKMLDPQPELRPNIKSILKILKIK